MKILGLSHRANTIVGDDLTRGVSGGERRRVTVGVELLKRCQLLVMDEATTGLDSSTSLQIFQALRIFADEVAPVFATLKQPGRELFELFDEIIVLHEGKIVYSGERGYMLDYFEESGYEVNRSINPADEVLSIVDEHGDELPEFFKKSGNESFDLEHAEHGEQLMYDQYSRNWFVQFFWGVKRGLQLIKNNPSITGSRVLFAILMALIVGTFFYQLGDHQSSIFGTQGALFIVATFPAFQALSGLPTVFSGRNVFYYQRRNNYYHAIPMQFADFVVSLPVTVIESVLFATICYWMIGFNSLFIRFFYFVLMVLVIEVYFSLVTKISGFLLPSFLIANILMPPTIFMQSFFSGYGIRPDRAPEYLQWLFYVSPFRYLYEGLCINEFLGLDLYCKNDEFVPPKSDPLFNKPFILGGFEGNQACPIEDGSEVLENMDFETEYAYTWYWFLVLIGYIIAAFLVMILSSYVIFKKKLPRNLIAVQERHIHNNEKMKRIKESISRTSMVALNTLHVHSEPDIEHSTDDSVSHTRTVFEVSAHGNRIETHLPVCLEWIDLTYTVKILPKDGIFSLLGNLPIISKFVQKDLTLLNGVSGYVKPGMIIAFMGPSGAGKTTLLDVLAQRKTAGKIGGKILVNGSPIDPSILPHFAGYVEQNNIHIESETVLEALKMSANLRLCYPEDRQKPISRRERIEHILWVMDILSLTEIQKAQISELSLEQKKRVTIAVELAANPSILWLDEPTSGLDAMAALKVMKAVKNIADSGVSVVCTLHQPSEVIFNWCTHLLLLARGGRVSFFGKIGGSCSEPLNYFAQYGLFPEPGQNLADFFLECCTSDSTNENGKTVPDGYKDSYLSKHVEEELEKGIAPRRDKKIIPWYRKPFSSSKDKENYDDDLFKPLNYSTRCCRSMLIQWMYLITRYMRLWWRSPTPVIIMVINSLVYGIVLGLLFSERDNSQFGADEIPALLYFVNLVLSKIVMTYIPDIFDQRAVFYRELASKEYNAVVYLISMVMVTCFLLTITGIPISVIPWLIGGLQRDWYRLGYMLGITVLTPIVAYGLALFLSLLVAYPEMGNGLFSITNLINSFVNGYVLLKDDIPNYWIWGYWIAFQHYTLEGLILNDLVGEEFECKNNEQAVAVNVPSEQNPDRIRYYCPIQTGEDMIEKLDMNDNWLLPDLLIVLAMVAGFFFISAIIITKIKHITR